MLIEILEDYIPAFSLTQLKKLNQKDELSWIEAICLKQILNNLTRAEEIDKMTILAGQMVEVEAKGYESAFMSDRPKEFRNRFMYQVKWNNTSFLIDAKMFGDNTPDLDGDQFHIDARINTIINTN